MLIQNYLFFDGRCEEALNFYRRALGAEITTLMRFGEMPGAGECGPDSASAHPGPPVPPEKVMHAEFRIGDTALLASDGYAQGKPEFKGFSLTINASDAADARRLFDLLTDGGAVLMALDKTFFSAAFGMVTDRFGVPWTVVAPV